MHAYRYPLFESEIKQVCEPSLYIPSSGGVKLWWQIYVGERDLDEKNFGKKC